MGCWLKLKRPVIDCKSVALARSSRLGQAVKPLTANSIPRAWQPRAIHRSKVKGQHVPSRFLPLSSCTAKKKRSRSVRRSHSTSLRRTRPQISATMAKNSLLDNASALGIVARVAAALSVLAIARFFYRLYQVRTLFREAAQKYGIVGLIRV